MIEGIEGMRAIAFLFALGTALVIVLRLRKG